VGKSTIAVNVAATLHKQGAKVGIFDSDIYGPSLPTLINKENESLRPYEHNEKEIEPIDYEGIKCMSFGFVGQKAAVMRGPIVSSYVSQLLYQTHWGELDYLVVDMPPGTGDVQLSLCQELKFDGAVIVTTPQRLSFIDVLKGIEMFQDLRVPILGIVENMSYYQCGKCGTKDFIFGRGYTQMLIDQFGIEVLPSLFRTPPRFLS
jgi:Mrp family chromosome partitioning ATPase